MRLFNGVKVYTATMQAERARIGDRITDWLRDHPKCSIVDLEVHQSSDASFHCLTMVLFYFDPGA